MGEWYRHDAEIFHIAHRHYAAKSVTTHHTAGEIVDLKADAGDGALERRIVHEEALELCRVGELVGLVEKDRQVNLAQRPVVFDAGVSAVGMAHRILKAHVRGDACQELLDHQR